MSVIYDLHILHQLKTVQSSDRVIGLGNWPPDPEESGDRRKAQAKPFRNQHEDL